MTETVGIRQRVTNPDYRSTTQTCSRFLPSRSSPGTFSYKRRTLNHWTNRIKTSGLSGTDIVSDYLQEKYIKNLSFHTIRHSGGTILSFLYFLHQRESSIFTLTRSDISAFVEYEQDKG